MNQTKTEKKSNASIFTKIQKGELTEIFNKQDFNEVKEFKRMIYLQASPNQHQNQRSLLSNNKENEKFSSTLDIISNSEENSKKLEMYELLSSPQANRAMTTLESKKHPSNIPARSQPNPSLSLSLEGVRTENEEQTTLNINEESNIDNNSKKKSLKKKKRRRGRVGAWKTEEDETLVRLVKKFGPRRWSTIAENVSIERNGKQCRERWYNHLDPQIKKDWWTVQEDKKIIELHEQQGNQWAKISKALEGRPANSVKNHWNSTLKRIIISTRRRLQHEHETEHKSALTGQVSVELEIPRYSRINGREKVKEKGSHVVNVTLHFSGEEQRQKKRRKKRKTVVEEEDLKITGKKRKREPKRKKETVVKSSLKENVKKKRRGRRKTRKSFVDFDSRDYEFGDEEVNDEISNSLEELESSKEAKSEFRSSIRTRSQRKLENQENKFTESPPLPVDETATPSYSSSTSDTSSLANGGEDSSSFEDNSEDPTNLSNKRIKVLRRGFYYNKAFANHIKKYPSLKKRISEVDLDEKSEEEKIVLEVESFEPARKKRKVE